MNFLVLPKQFGIRQSVKIRFQQGGRHWHLPGPLACFSLNPAFGFRISKRKAISGRHVAPLPARKCANILVID
ncbi:MAG: hypothetical protein FWD68_03430 [Alphaproteobacteria bacterium]|nr:hypothetical protein [Alphaproteobacteria bacterium]